MSNFSKGNLFMYFCDFLYKTLKKTLKRHFSAKNTCLIRFFKLYYFRKHKIFLKEKK